MISVLNKPLLRNQQSILPYFVIFDNGWNNTRTSPKSGLFLAIDDLNVTAFGTSITYAMRDNADDSIEYGIQTDASGNVDIVENGSVVASDVTMLSTSTNYDLAIALDDNKIAHYFLYSSTQSEWRRIYVGTFATSAALLYANDTTVGATYTANQENFGTGMPYEAETVDIAAPASQSGNLLDADFTLRVTAPSAGIFQFDFRKQDATNYWRLEYSVTGNTYKVIETIAGTPTTRITYAGAPGSEALFVQAYGNTIKIWSAGALRGTYTSANNFLRETAWVISSAGTATANLKVWKSYTRNEAGLGAELVTDGTMSDNVSNWPAIGTPTTREYSGGRLRLVADAGAEGIFQTKTLTTSSYYIFVFDYDVISGTLTADILATVRPYTEDLINSGTIDVFFIATQSTIQVRFYTKLAVGAGEFYIDNVSVKQQLFSTDTLGNKLNQAVA